MKYLATADWHISSQPNASPWDDVPDAWQDQFVILELVAKYCANNNIDLLAAGDLFNKARVDAVCLEMTSKALNPIRDSNVNHVLYIEGNHDGKQDWLATLNDYCKNVYTKGSYYEDVTGMSYTPVWPPPKWQFSGKVPRIGLYHQQWKNWFGGGTADVNDLPGHEYMICGDIHVFGKAVTNSGGIALSPGPFIPMKYTEIQTYSAGRYYLLEDFDDDEDKLCITEIVLPTRVYKLIEIGEEPEKALSSISEKIEVHKNCPSRISTPIVVIKGILPEGFKESAEIAAKRNNVHIVFRGGSAPKRVANKNSSVTRNSSRKTLVETVKSWPTLDEDDKKLATRLLDSSDPNRLLKEEYSTLVDEK